MESHKDRNLKVLIIEDNPGHLSLLKKLLQQHGCICTDCMDGRTGLAEAMENEYDMIFVDIRLPEIDGFLIATKLRDSGHNVPLIATTAVNLENIERYAKAVGYNMLISKPITEEMIQEILHNSTFFQSQ